MKIRLSVFASLLAFALVLWCWPSENAPASDAVLVRYWNGFTGPDGRTMLRMVKRFNRENPGAHVLMQRMDWSTYFNKLFVAGLGGRGPDLFVVHVSDMPRLMRAGFLREVGIALFQTSYYSEYGLTLAACVISTLPAILAFLLFQKHIIEGIALTGLKE